MSDYRSAKMSYMEGLGKIGRGVVENDRLSLSKICGSTVIFLLFKYLWQDLLAKIRIIYFNIQIAVYSLCGCNRTSRKTVCKSSRNLHGRATKRL